MKFLLILTSLISLNSFAAQTCDLNASAGQTKAVFFETALIQEAELDDEFLDSTKAAEQAMHYCKKAGASDCTIVNLERDARERGINQNKHYSIIYSATAQGTKAAAVCE